MAFSPETYALLKAQGGGGSGGGDNLFPIQVDEDGVLDKTWSEISTAAASGKLVYIYSGTGFEIPRVITYDDDKPNPYVIYLISYDNSMGYWSATENGYPEFFD